MKRLTGAVVIATTLVACVSAPGPRQPVTPDGVASVTSPLALTADGRTLWVINPDAGSVTAVDTRTLEAAAPIAVGAEPWAVAITPKGSVVVANRADGSVAVLRDGRVDVLEVGAEPGGLALSPTGRYAVVSLSTSGSVAVVDLERLEVLGSTTVGPSPWSIAVTDDGDPEDLDETVVVAHRLARSRPGGSEGQDDGKEGWVTQLPLGELMEAAASGTRVPDLMASVIEPYGFGYPNGLETLALDGGRVYVAHLLNAPEYPRDFDTTVSAAVSSLALEGGDARADGALRLHLNDESFSTPVNHPTGIALAADGQAAYVSLGGSDVVMGIDLAAADGPELIGFWPTGSNPRGIVLSRDGARAYVMNYLSRDVSVLDLEDREGRSEIARVSAAAETLPADELRGKVLFHNASSSRISRLGWIACASCHLGGGADGTTWHTPDGPRQTMPLWQLEGTAPFHASATRDEVQDFERDIEELMGGSGLAPGAYRSELGEPNGGLSDELDALARYVLTGIRVPVAPAVDAEAAVQGRLLYAQLGCQACHAGPAWTLSTLPGEVGTLAPNGEPSVGDALRDVGTYDPGADVLGGDGFDVPTLLGVHATAPYLHDGSAATLEDVLRAPDHAGRELSETELVALAAFLTSLDANTPSF